MSDDTRDFLPIIIPADFSPTGEVITIPLAEIPDDVKAAYPWAKHYLVTLALTGNKTTAAQHAGVHFGAIKKAAQLNAEFAELEDMAREISIGRLEAIGRARAEKSSDLLMMFFLKAMRPGVYRDKYEQVQKAVNDYVIDITPERTGSNAKNSDKTTK